MNSAKTWREGGEAGWRWWSAFFAAIWLTSGRRCSQCVVGKAHKISVGKEIVQLIPRSAVTVSLAGRLQGRQSRRGSVQCRVQRE